MPEDKTLSRQSYGGHLAEVARDMRALPLDLQRAASPLTATQLRAATVDFRKRAQREYEHRMAAAKYMEKYGIETLTVREIKALDV